MYCALVPMKTWIMGLVQYCSGLSTAVLVPGATAERRSSRMALGTISG